MKATTIYKCSSNTQYTKISNQLLQNSQLSYRARGVMAYILSLPADWEIYVSFLTNETKERLCAIKASLKELNALGYMHIMPMRDAATGKMTGRRWVAFDEPMQFEQAKALYGQNCLGVTPTPQITDTQKKPSVGQSTATKEINTKKGNSNTNTKEISEGNVNTFLLTDTSLSAADSFLETSRSEAEPNPPKKIAEKKGALDPETQKALMAQRLKDRQDYVNRMLRQSKESKNDDMLKQVDW